MRQKLFIIFGSAVLIVVLIGLNAISYTQREKELDNESNPNRSTYNLGATGTRAFFDLLTETGRKPVRWQSPPAELLLDNKTKPATFVIVGKTRREISPEETAQILQWVSEGGKLVIIDRAPPESLVTTSADWRLSFGEPYRQPDFTTDASEQKEMTLGIKAAKPVQPTIFTQNVNAVQTSAFVAPVNFERLPAGEIEKRLRRRLPDSTPLPVLATPKPRAGPPQSFPTPAGNANSSADRGSRVRPAEGLGSGSGREPAVAVNPPPEKKSAIQSAPLKKTDEDDEADNPSAPVVHLNADGRNLLVDVPYGAGRIVFLSDPYIVANGGVGLVDNAQLAINVVASRAGIVAFDEYHQGYGANSNRFFQFFAGTPVIPIFIQAALLVGLLFYSQSRRFARAVPEPEPSRLSKLEYVAAMAELQQRTKGYDLAIENIYTDFRRRVSRLVGVDALKTRREELALLIGERLPDENPVEIEQLMRRCEDVMHGDATGKKEVLRLTARLRELEEKLGLQRRKRRKP